MKMQRRYPEQHLEIYREKVVFGRRYCTNKTGKYLDIRMEVCVVISNVGICICMYVFACVSD